MMLVFSRKNMAFYVYSLPFMLLMLFVITAENRTCDVEKEFRCGNSMCILKDRVCDGEDDCKDLSDEQSCSERSCTPKQFLCNSTDVCIPEAHRCDHEKDCDDNSDEENCPPTTCQDTDFQCVNLDCIKMEYQCDGENDCRDGSDELNCPDRNYTDIDECASGQHTCEQICTNVKGEYKCDCYDGYVLESDRQCRAIDSAIGKDEISLIVAAKTEIRRINLNNRRFSSVLVANLGQASGLALDVRRRLLFWTDPLEENLNSMAMDSTGNGKSVDSLLSPESIRSPFGLAVDWVNDLLYWTDYSVQKVMVSCTNGSWPTTVTTLNGITVSSIAVHPKFGYLFVNALRANEVAIRRYGMNGGEYKSIIRTDIGLPTGLSIDYHQGRLFWADAKLQTLSSCDFDGSKRRSVLESNAFPSHQPYGVAVVFNRVYWTEKISGKVFSCNKWTGTDVIQLDSNLRSPVAVQGDLLHTQPNFAAACHKHHCQFLCLPRPLGGYACSCPHGYVSLVADNSRCKKVGSFHRLSTGRVSASTGSIATATNMPFILHSSADLDTEAASVETSATPVSTRVMIVVSLLGGFAMLFFTLASRRCWHQCRERERSVSLVRHVHKKSTSRGSCGGICVLVSMPKHDSEIQLLRDDQSCFSRDFTKQENDSTEHGIIGDNESTPGLSTEENIVEVISDKHNLVF